MPIKVFNLTDGIPATPRSFRTKKSAEKFIAEFRARFKPQGYYLTSDLQRIKPEQIHLEVRE